LSNPPYSPFSKGGFRGILSCNFNFLEFKAVEMPKSERKIKIKQPYKVKKGVPLILNGSTI